MKKLIPLITSLFAVLALSGCNELQQTVYPVEEQTEIDKYDD
ncbi:hypothetical protein [Alkalicoccus daliensis]|uniref:Lipoprotein n=1 Tax=Alkalicoccus daliensis TaxID=745820 RepID=A0A1H0JLD3_9BACI|nr:hypothetical protein [Alkalicoccus daliensis]SDO44526.1 hypothetical protein SAMN04488053_11410 [Alkalicoccus daliensis]